MGGSVARVVSAVATGGLSEAVRPVAKATGVPNQVLDPTGAAVAAATDKLTKPAGSSAPTATPGPVAPNMQDVAKQAQLDEQKRLSMTGPSDTTNVGGAKGILTDPNAKYVTGKLLGGA